jgi:DNA-binding response OmpR family regulator
MYSILVVEDEASLSSAMTKKLKLNDFLVFNANSVDEAMTILRDNKIDVVLLDHQLLGKGNGLDLVVEMKKEGSPWRSTLIFVDSNTANPENIESYIELGVNKCYIKSNVSLENIIKDIRKLLDGAKV